MVGSSVSSADRVWLAGLYSVMTLALTADPLPLTADADGVLRVGATRVSLATLVTAFLEGATAEEIAQQYPSLSLPDVYAVISYYLRHPAEVNDYLLERQQEAGQVRLENERRFDPEGVRERLLARRAKG